MDIKLSDGNGLVFARENINLYPCIIFVTSHKELVYDAFLPNVFGFILKERMEMELLRKISRVQKHIIESEIIKLQTNTGIIKLSNQKINYFTTNYDSFYVVTDQSICIRINSLKSLKEMLPNYYFQINRSDIVNLYRIKNLYRNNHTIELMNKNILKVSERKWKLFKETYIMLMDSEDK